MKFNTIIKKSIAVSSLALVATACKPSMIEEEPLLFALASSQIRSLAEGNCAISLNLGTLYSGAIIQRAVSTNTVFTQADYEAASGTSVGAGQTYSTFESISSTTPNTAVPYNLRYDAFIKGGGTYTAESRQTDINSAKASVDLAAIAGAWSVAAGAADSTNPQWAGNATATASVQALYATLTDAEKTAAATAGGTNKAGLDAVVAGPATDSLCAFASGGAVANCATLNGLPLATRQGAASAVIAAYQARQAFSNGTGILACARIPASSCNLSAITTPSRSAAIASAEGTYNNIASNSDCRKPDADFMNRVRSNLFVGTPRGTSVLGTPASPSDAIGSISEGSTFSNNRIFPEAAYPISPALSNISTAFNVAFPLSSGATAQASSTIPYYKASNINVGLVASCESIGFTGNGPINTAPANQAAVQARRPLSDVKEILYAFSPLNSAASTYAAVRGATQDNATVDQARLDAIACNNSFRSKLSIPLVVGGGSLSKLNNAVSGDGGASANLSTCLYGGTAAGRTTSGSLLSTTALNGIDSCPTAAASAAARFGDEGLNTLADFPNNAAAQ